MNGLNVTDRKIQREAGLAELKVFGSSGVIALHQVNAKRIPFPLGKRFPAMLTRIGLSISIRGGTGHIVVSYDT